MTDNAGSQVGALEAIKDKLKGGDLQGAQALAASMAQGPGGVAQGLAEVGGHLLKMGQAAAAVQVLEPFASAFAKDVAFNWLLAGAYGLTYRHGKAESHLRFVADHAPAFAAAQFGMGRNLFKAGRNEEAVPYLRRAVKLEPTNAEALEMLSFSLGETGGYNEAQEMMAKAAALSNADGKRDQYLQELATIAVAPPPKDAFVRWPRDAKEFQDLPGIINKYVVANYDTKGVALRRGMSVFAQGSCFAGNLASSLRRYDLNVAQLPCGEDHNSTFANRVVLDWLSRGVLDERTEIVAENLGADKRELYRESLRKTDLFVFTLGLAAVHRDRENGEFVMSRATSFSRAALLKRADFRTSSVAENVDNLRHIIDTVRSLAPNAAVVLTLSPVPLRITTEFNSAVVADCLSKSTLRLAVQDVLNMNLPKVLYWPSFEIVRWIGAHTGPVYGSDDGSPHHVDFRVINHVIDAFVEKFGDADLKSTKRAVPLDAVK